MKRIFFLFLLFLLIDADVSAQIKMPPLSIHHLTDSFYVYESYGAYQGQATSANAMYLVTKVGVVLFDTPWDDIYYQPLLDSIMNRHHKKVIICIATHFHKDRTGGLEYYAGKGIKTYTTKLTDSLSIINHAKRAQHLIQSDTSFHIGGYTFQTYYAGAGHTLDNIVILIPAVKILYGGCLIKSSEAKTLGFLGDADVNAWRHTMLRIEKKFPNPRFVIVGHDDYTNLHSIKHTLEMIAAYQHK